MTRLPAPAAASEGQAAASLAGAVAREASASDASTQDVLEEMNEACDAGDEV